MAPTRQKEDEDLGVSATHTWVPVLALHSGPAGMPCGINLTARPLWPLGRPACQENVGVPGMCGHQTA